VLINTIHNEFTFLTRNTPCRVVATPSFGNSVDKPSTLTGLFVVMNHQEEWRPIAGTKKYEVSNMGRVKSVSRYVPNNINGGCRLVKQRRLAQKTKPNGYKEVALYLQPQVATMRYVHRLVAEAFIGPIPEGMAVNHLDGDKTNNKVSNLEIITASANSKHAVDMGLYAPPAYKGSKHPRSKIDESRVLEIRAEYAKNNSINRLVESTGLPKGTVAKICYRQTWTHI
jgi:hypothetical protein